MAATILNWIIFEDFLLNYDHVFRRRRPLSCPYAELGAGARGTFVSGGGRHTVRIDLPPGLPRVMADRQRTVQVLNNLLANAGRHSPESAPIRIAAEREGLHVAVSVADEGRGIAPDHLGQLFRKYTAAGDRKGGVGVGLGLAICKGLVEAHGGRIRAEKPRLVLVDLMLPGTDGVELMRTVPGLADLPVVFFSSYGGDETIARALEAGADDYVVKPFSPTELTARIRAALRRRSNPTPFVLGELAIDYDRRRVSVAGRPVTLTATEYDLLRVLAQGAGRVLTHEALLRQVWAGLSTGDPKRVRAYVKRLRQRLGDDAASPTWIFNERGVGYRMPRPGDPGEP